MSADRRLADAERRWGSGGWKSARVQNQLFEAALAITTPWSVNGVDFDAAKEDADDQASISSPARGFPATGVAGVHPVHDTQDQAPAASQFLPARMLPGSQNAAGEVARRAGRSWIELRTGSASLRGSTAVVRGAGAGHGPAEMTFAAVARAGRLHMPGIASMQSVRALCRSRPGRSRSCRR